MPVVMRTGILGALSAALLVAAHPAAAAEEATLRAFLPWQGQGQVVQTGPREATFVGIISGIVYVDTEKGPVEAGQMICPATVRINLDDGAQTGTGNCTMTGPDGARVFGRMNCAGFHLVGCDGDFTLTGGTARFTGIAGGGRFTLRSSLHALAASAGTAVQESATGTIYWRELRYAIP